MPNKIGNEMIGKTYLYNGDQHTIQRIEPYEDDLVDVYTDKRRIRISKGELKELFKPVHVPAVRNNGSDTALITLLQAENKPMDDLAATLDNVIKKIEADETYIKRAKAINETARSIINLRKAQIELFKLAKK
jgi:hypothetical protein